MYKIQMTGIILAGAKALLPAGGETAVEYLVRLSSSFFAETFVIAAKNRNVSHLELGRASVLADLFPNQGALGGLYTGLSYSMHNACYVMACDEPEAQEKQLRKLVRSWKADCDILCYAGPEGPKPFPGIYLRTTRHMIKLLLERSEFSLRGLTEAAAVRTLPLPRAQNNRDDEENKDYRYRRAVLRRSENP